MVVELGEELLSKGGVVADGSGGGCVIGGSWRVDGRIRVPGHLLSVVFTKGVLAESGMGVVVFKGLGFLFGFSALGLLLLRGLLVVAGAQVPC